MSGTKKLQTKQLSNWPEHKLPWKHVRAEALKKNMSVSQYVYEAIVQRIKGGW